MIDARRLVSQVTIVVVALSSFDCTSWRKQSASPEHLLADKPGLQLRVHVEGWKLPIEVSSAQVAADTLYGLAHYVGKAKARPSYWRPHVKHKHDSVAIPFSAIRMVEARKFSAGKTAFLVVGLGATALLVAAIVVAETGTYGLGGSSGGSSSGDSFGASCPLILSWDGSEWLLDSGTYAGAIMPALARTDVDVLEHATVAAGDVRLRLTGLSGETEHVDAVAIQAVDHPRGTFIAPDQKGQLHVLTDVGAPLSARSLHGRDERARVVQRDGWGWESSLAGRDPSRDSDVRDGIEVEFLKPAGPGTAYVVVEGSNTPWAACLMRRFVAIHGSETQGWYDTVAAHPEERAALVAGFAREAFLRVSAWDGARWVEQGAVPEVGPEVTKSQVIAIDLATAPGARIRLRLESAAALWNIDRVGLAIETGQKPVARDLPLLSAKDQATGSVESLISSAGDGKEYVIEPGAAAELRFRPSEPRPDLLRTFVARTTGWYEIHAADKGEPDRVLLSRLTHEPLAASRYSVQQMNAALAALELQTR